jgi:hypothetical protein
MTTEFHKVVRDFVHDLLRVFPERADTLHVDLQTIAVDGEDAIKASERVKEHCLRVLPQRFFDILYQNEAIFDAKEDGQKENTEFLPGLDFGLLWKADGVSDETRTTMWKYLQLILVSVVEDISDKESFGETANLFEAINEDELKTKLEETVQHMQSLFEDNQDDEEGKNDGDDSTDTDPADGAERAQALHDHIAGMLDGKLGKLAKEIAADAAAELGIDEEKMGQNASVEGVFKKLFQNPGKLMGLVKNIGGKLDAKIKSGEIKESEILQEASELMGKMKDMPGMGDMQSLLGKMGMGGKGKVNMSAFRNHMQTSVKHAQTKERMQAKLAARKAAAAAQANQKPEVFSTGEKVERTPVGAERPPNADGSALSKSQKKRKKRKAKAKAGDAEPSAE